MNPRTKHLVKNFALSGAAVGGSAALLTSAVNYIKYLREKADRDKGTNFDDSVMYVDVPVDGVKKATVGGGVALTAGTLSTLGTYMLGRHLYQKAKKKQLQKDLDQTQQLYWDKLMTQAEGVKKASQPGTKPMSAAELITASPFAATMLAAVASGIVTNRILDHHYPNSKKVEKKDSRPKSIRVRYTKNGKPVGGQVPIEVGGGALVENEDMVKESSHLDGISEADILQSEMFLCDIALGMAKSASYLPDLIFSVAHGNLKELEDNITQYGVEPALEMVKGASHSDIPMSARKMAVNLSVNSEVLRPIVSTLAAAEFFENCPTHSVIAASVPLMEADGLVKMAAAMNAIETEDVLDTVIGETSTEPEEAESDFQELSPRELLRQLLAQEMDKYRPEAEDDKKEDKNDVIDNMLALS